MKLPQTPPDSLKIMAELGAETLLKSVRSADGPTVRGKYLHWDELRFRTPPEGLTHEEWWIALKFARRHRKRIGLRDCDGTHFSFMMPDTAQEQVHKIDCLTAGNVASQEEIINPEIRDRYIISSLVEEAITSSQLEGAATTRRVAKEMLRSGREPKDIHERMIFNNFMVMERIHDLSHEDLTLELILELHRIVTDRTLKDPSAAGRLRGSGVEDDVKVFDPRDGELLHTPPDWKELPKRIDRLCKFANGKDPKYFIHPVVRAILVHFWLAYDHPFVDGNGRTARALFYWSMLRQDYSLFMYISISQIVKTGPAKYARAFLHTETDENDLTYFIDYHLRVIRQAVNRLSEHVEQKRTEMKQTQALIRRSVHLNSRQFALLGHALRHPGFAYTARSHKFSHNVTSQTARNDLKQLGKEGLLLEEKGGRKLIFRAPEDLLERLKRSHRKRKRARS